MSRFVLKFGDDPTALPLLTTSCVSTYWLNPHRDVPIDVKPVWVGVGAQGAVDLPGDVALDAAQDRIVGYALGAATVGVRAGLVAVTQPDDGDHLQRGWSAVAAGIEPMPDRLAR